MLLYTGCDHLVGRFLEEFHRKTRIGEIENGDRAATLAIGVTGTIHPIVDERVLEALVTIFTGADHGSLRHTIQKAAV